MTEHLTQNHPGVERDFGILVSVSQSAQVAVRVGTHPLSAEKMVSSLALRYSTVGQRLPI